MWLAVPGRDTEEQLYYGALLSLFSTLTCCLDQGAGKGRGHHWLQGYAAANPQGPLHRAWLAASIPGHDLDRPAWNGTPPPPWIPFPIQTRLSVRHHSCYPGPQPGRSRSVPAVPGPSSTLALASSHCPGEETTMSVLIIQGI